MQNSIVTIVDTKAKLSGLSSYSDINKEAVSGAASAMILPGCQTRDSVSSSKFHHLAFLALLVALVSYSHIGQIFTRVAIR